MYIYVLLCLIYLKYILSDILKSVLKIAKFSILQLLQNIQLYHMRIPRKEIILPNYIKAEKICFQNTKDYHAVLVCTYCCASDVRCV